MTFLSGQGSASYVPPNIIIPEDAGEARLVLTDYLIKMAHAINEREIATYQDATLSGGVNISETLNAQAWFTPSDPNKLRYGSRTVVNFGTLPNNTTTTVAHGITVSTNTVFTNITGAASIPGTKYIPLPYPESAGSNVEVWVDATNVNIKTTTDYSAYTQAYVVLEYIESV